MEARRPRRRGTLVAPVRLLVLAIIGGFLVASCDIFGPTTGSPTLLIAPTPSASPSPTPTPTPTPTPKPTPTASVTPKSSPSASLGNGGISPCPGKNVTAGSGPLDSEGSTNWSGYAATSNDAPITCIEATWVQPSISCGKTSHSAISMWVGIGGFDQDYLEQVGSEVDCDLGKISHFLWHESLPRERFEQRLDLTIKAGDHLRARVRALSASKFELAIANLTRHTSFTTTDTNSKLERNSGEWILEAPTGGCPSACKILPMPNFHTFKFSGTWATVGGLRQPLDGTSFTHVRVKMVTKNGTTRAAVSSTAGDGSAFVVTWKRS
jgi:hypothetical protein